MGFMELLGKVAGDALNSVADSAKQQQEYVNQYREWDDERLIRRSKNETDHKRKMAMLYVLKERGYGNDN